MLRILLESDIPILLAIEIVTQADPWTEETFLQCLRMGYDGWVMERDARVVGFILVSNPPVGESHILNLCVDPDYQHQGIGRTLLHHALEQSKQMGAGIAYLEVRRSNEHAIALYRQVGFFQVSVRKKYYHSNEGSEDALIFAKDLGID